MRRLVFAFALIAGGALIGAASSASEAATVRPAVALGSPAADVVAAMGPPVRISFDQAIQVWYYRRDDGGLKARYEINQGLVVRIR